ncbi:NAD(P)/FAD-dependent oxidoreductase [Mycobacterium pseudokansasii]|uniref:D-amino acid dehydrogenase 1 n=1 Tax=Mycobacterium pseudokansasii TaxID=2341080 RepID=A0A498QQP2_9MYCO|nr:FAD-dependent oxidoreductase [Mycobacterium pseudokansasii]KZS61744.1 amino acid dehydrogenase [Mycobacterium kansasii]VAZ93968.1 D-amino acid dehydrogenase 1 [Mycobacterium pseudokansasii]VAZ94970.1 D-amino acid dehydrogenase 1 [Mycobacterium pseudokansasii]VBA50105.1 D-amino acid dehydrogenase 1 [Mycobacterium pseudokansasii]
MAGVDRIDDWPRSVVVVGAGIVGLSTAWFLQERGVNVTVVDRDGVGAGASGGNAGWIAPGLALPLNSPAVLRYGIRSLLDSKAPLHIPFTADMGLGMFLARFAGHCRRSSWQRAVRANAILNEDCIEAFDVLIANGVDAPVTDAPITAVFDSTAAAQRFQEDLQELGKAGQTTDITVLTGAALREQVPLASRAVRVGLSVNGQRFIDPARFVAALGRAVVNRGATLRTLEITEIVNATNSIAVRPCRGAPLITDAAVIATGAQLPQLAGRRLGVAVRAGRGYSFTVPVERPMPWPIYLPSVRVAATPHHGAMRVSGTMEFRHPRAPLIPDRVAAIVASAGPLLDGVRWAERSNVWVGARPIAADGRPVIGAVSPRVFVAGGHGMWGLAHGPVTGRLLAEQITTGKQPQALREFDPLRGRGR